MGGDRHKVGCEVGACHVSHGEGAVGAALGAEPVAHRQGIDWGGKLRQTDELDIAVSRAAAGQRKCVACNGVGIGRAVGHVRHVGSRGAVGVALPARRQFTGSAVGCASHGVEILHVWRHDKVAAGRDIAWLAPAAGISGTTDGTHAELIRCGRGETRDGGGMRHDGGGVGDAVTRIHNLPGKRRAIVGPVDGSGCSGSCSGMHIARGRAGGDIVEVEVIDIGIPRAAGTEGADGRKMTIACITGQGYLKLSPVGVAGNGDSVKRHKSGGVVGVGHHTHVEDRGIRGRRCLGPEGELESTDSNGRVNLGHNHNLVVAIGAGSGGVVPVQTLGAARCVVVGAGTGDIGVAEVGGAVVQACPAADK